MCFPAEEDAVPSLNPPTCLISFIPYREEQAFTEQLSNVSGTCTSMNISDLFGQTKKKVAGTLVKMKQKKTKNHLFWWFTDFNSADSLMRLL